MIGAGLMRHAVAREAAAILRRPLRIAAVAGAVLVLALSALDLALTLRGTLGFLATDLLLDYAQSSFHGRATILRALLAVALAALAFLARGRWTGAGWLAGSVALLYTFSAISHNASMPGRLPVAADLVHLSAAVGWAGAVLGAAFLPIWSGGTNVPAAQLDAIMARVSRIGLAGVLVLFATGVYSAQLHVGEPSALVATRYGWALVAKLSLVAVIVGIAALNRWRFLPALRRDGASPGLVHALRVEALLLLAVLGATGLLTTSPMPH